MIGAKSLSRKIFRGGSGNTMRRGGRSIKSRTGSAVDNLSSSRSYTGSKAIVPYQGAAGRGGMRGRWDRLPTWGKAGVVGGSGMIAGGAMSGSSSGATGRPPAHSSGGMGMY